MNKEIRSSEDLSIFANNHRNQEPAVPTDNTEIVKTIFDIKSKHIPQDGQRPIAYPDPGAVNRDARRDLRRDIKK